MRLDHVIFACPAGLDAAAEWLLRKHRLRTLPGGVHTALGTANRILPLADGGYLEFAAVMDPKIAMGTSFGRLVAQHNRPSQVPGRSEHGVYEGEPAAADGNGPRAKPGTPGGTGPMKPPTARPIPAAWCVAVDDLDADCDRLGLQPNPAQRTRPDGVTLRWRLAGVEVAATTPYLPFLINWEVPENLHPSAAAPNDGPAVSLVELRVTGDRDRLVEWVDGGLEGVPIVVRPGAPAVHACVIDIEGRTIVL